MGEPNLAADPPTSSSSSSSAAKPAPSSAVAAVPRPAATAAAAEPLPECVKVCVRVRPLSSREEGEGSACCVKFPATNAVRGPSSPP
jgi:hypothetical protein